jgi:PST family polysaccharide transporter
VRRASSRACSIEAAVKPSTRSDDSLDVDDLRADLAERAVRGSAATLGIQVSTVLGALVATAVLARLLTPGDFGLVAMALVVLGLFQIAGELGLPAATVQTPEIDRAKLTSLFWLQVSLGVALALALAGSAPLVARLYGEPRLVAVVGALSAVLWLRALGYPQIALLRRRMRFAAYAVSELSGVLAGFAAGCALAIGGAGYWALVGQQLAGAAVATGAAWGFSSWRPERLLRWAGVRDLVGFGARLTASTLFAYGARSLDRLLIGSLFGDVALGLYATPQRLQERASDLAAVSIARVAPGVLSRLQAEPDRYRRAYRQALLYGLSVSAPVPAFLCVDAGPLVATLLGPQWLDAIPIFRLLAVAGLAATLQPATRWVYLSRGRMDRLLRWTAIESAALAAAVVLGVRWGALGVAAALALIGWLLRLPDALFCFRGAPVAVSDVAAAAWRPFAAALLAAPAPLALQALRGAAPGSPIDLGVDLITFGALYVAAWLALPGGRGVAAEALRLARALRRPGAPQAAGSRP